jgi:hypothetical protein
MAEEALTLNSDGLIQKPPRTWTKKDGLRSDNVRWRGETSNGAVWAS